MLLHGLIGYDSRPDGMQLVFYIAALVTIGIGMTWAGQTHKQKHPTQGEV
jgi:high-affinity iron transporter